LGFILERVNNPGDLKKLNLKEMDQLAHEIRELMIDVISKRGGHLAPSLGVVELTIALHSIFNSPVDKIIWDVGHQSYAHKILTGRKEKFDTIRTQGGISGFPKRGESPHDIFGTGHSSTSISAAMGIALARDLRGEDFKVIAVIGDGALTGGMAFEAMNYVGDTDTDLLVILNDNEMSIDINVGGLPSYLAKLRADPKYFRFKEDIGQMLGRIPALGPVVVRSAERFKDGIKYMFVPGVLFEELGFTYLGPIDGHHILKLKEIFQQTKSIKGPVLLHVVTQKGKGYLPAEKEPHRYHGVAPFVQKTGKPLVSQSAAGYSNIFGTTLVELASRNSSLVAVTAAMAAGTGLEEFSKQLPERFIDVGIAEQHAVTMAAGLAAEGFRPVVAIYSTFLQRAYDQVLHDVCLQNLPVLFAIDRAGIVGEDGETHNGIYDLAYLRHMPNIVLMAPGSGPELSLMLEKALTWNCPTALRYPRGVAEEQPFPLSPELAIGKGVLLKEGDDLLILAVGSMVMPALQAHELLLAKGIRSSVINARFVKPLDRELITAWAGRCKKVLTVEEHILAGGFGSAVLEMLQEQQLQGITVKCLGIKNTIVDQGSRGFLLNFYGLSGEGIAAEALRLCRTGEDGRAENG
jgi:1-deoxy-D-xylulose-5-phosphate synthase